jgi:uncharacterized repeat protein (TIGR02543 family)
MTKENNAFGGWFREAEFTTPWDFAADTVTGDITLYGKWEPLSGGNKAVTWELNGGRWSGGGMPENQVTDGGKIRRPDDPIKNGFTFGGWYKEPALNNRWVFGTDTVTADITLYAKWEPVRTVTTRIVTFDAKGGDPAPGTQTVAQGGKVREPPAMTKTGLTPGGWFRDQGLTAPWDFGTDTVTTNITLYARWTAAVTFEANGGTPLQETQIVTEGDKAEPPAITKAKHLSVWYKEPELTNEWFFASDTVTENITLYAGWTYDFTTPEQYRTTVLLDGGIFPGDTAYSTLFPVGRNVTLSDFSIAKYETTYELWYEVYDWAIGEGYTIANAGREGYYGTDGDEPTSGAKTEPVTYISWRDAVVWCNAYSEMSGKEPVYYTDDFHTVVLKSTSSADSAKMKTAANGYRLPTEAEWEYAARGGGTPNPDPSSYFMYTYAGSNTVGDVAWYSGNSSWSTHPVGDLALAANSAGLYDMSGNVWEWCWDRNGSVVGGEVKDPVGPDAGATRVIRGGSWSAYASSCAVAYRTVSNPDNWDGDLGFRVVARP